jgi:hypothetical protein
MTLVTRLSSCRPPVLLLVPLVLALGGCAQLPSRSETEAATAGAVESTQRSVRSSALWLARGVDSWFGDRPFEDGGAVRDGRLSLNLRQRQDEGFSASLRLNARFSLPNLEALGYFFVGRDNPRDIITDQPGAFTSGEKLVPDPDERLSFFAGFGRALTDAVDLRVGFRGGIKPYVQARYRKPWQLGPDDRVEFRQTVFWSSDDRLGATAAVNVEHVWSPALIGRWVSAATVTQEEPDLGWQSQFSLHRGFGPERWLTLEALLSGRRDTGVDVQDYGLQARWEQPLHRDRLAGEISVGHFWPRPEATAPRARAWAVGLGLKLRF